MASFALVVLAGLVDPHTTEAQTVTAGTTPVQFAVTPGGAAQYSVPIAAPPGTAGMAPSLALAYNSQGGNGLLGIGWSLSGLSAITRCPKTLIQDGVKSAIKYDSSDSYCLDGQRLVVVNGGTYGANLTEYRTERDGFSRIISNESSGTPSATSGPAWFKVWTKSGQILEFGDTTDSAIEAQGKLAVKVWSVNKISDTKGNYLTITYTEDNTNGQYYPARIDYTRNDNITPALAAYNSVRFSYLARPNTDITPLYDLGSKVSITVLLSDIQTYANVNGTDTLVKDYHLSYGLSAGTQRSKLSILTECDGLATSTTTTCLSPTYFTYSDGSGNVNFSPLSGSNSVTMLPLTKSDGTIGYRLGDFNGDGKTDILAYGNATSSEILLSKGDGSFTVITPSIQLPQLNQSNGTIGFQLGDFNGDGKTDILIYGDTLSNNALYLSNGDGNFTKASLFNLTQTSLNKSDGTIGFQLGDFNGDGRTDILTYGDYVSNNALYLSNGDGSFQPSPTSFNLTQTSLNTSSAVQGFLGFQLGDFNGDGKTDILTYGDTAPNALYLSNGDGSFTPSTAFNLGSTSLHLHSGTKGFQLGDFNGDGKTDILAYDRSNTTSNNAVYLSSGDGSFQASPSGFNLATYNLQKSDGSIGFQLGDFNGDGRTDILIYDGSGLAPNNAIYLSNGDGSFTSTAVNATAFNLNTTLLSLKDGTARCQLGDFNGNGITDILLSEDAWGNNALYTSAAPFPDLLTGITNGLGATTTITYLPLTNSSVYTKGTGAAYPVMDFQSPLYVVSSVSSSNGIGGNYVTNYNYAGAQIHLTGGGFLGFNTTGNTDTQTNITSTTTYRQDYPFQGLPASVTVAQSNGSLLKQVTNTWTYKSYPDTVLPVLPATFATTNGSKHLFPYLSASVEASWDLNGAAMPAVTTVTGYNDDYGNPTSITVSTPDGYSKTTTNVYNNDAVNWYFGRLISATVQSTTP